MWDIVYFLIRLDMVWSEVEATPTIAIASHVFEIAMDFNHVGSESKLESSFSRS